jgi:hypothetical protein
MNEAGDILAAWTLFKSGSGTPRVSRFTWTSTWSAPVNVAGAGVNGGVTGIAAQASGIGLAAWGGRSPDAVTVAALTQPGATWNLPFPVTGASVLVYEAWPHLDDAGRGIVAWIYQSDVRISRSTSVSNRQWTTPVALTATHSVGALRAAMDGPSGRAVLAVLDSGNLSALEFD